MERLLEIKDPLTLALSNLSAAPEPLDAREWALIAECIPILKPLEILTQEFSGEKYVTISSIIPLIRGLQHQLRNLQPTSDTGLWLQQYLTEVISRRLAILEKDKIVAKSTFLDPRYKKVAFGLEENSKNAEKWISEEISAMIARTRNSEKSGVAEDEDEPDEPPTSSKSTATPSSSTQHSLWEHFEQKLAQCKTKTHPTTTAMLYLRQYLELPHCDRLSNPLEFWEKHKYTMPELYKLHLKYLGIPATSVPSERLFSKVGQMTHVRRNRLLPKNLDIILFLNSHF